MPNRRNENTVLSRQEPFAYVASFTNNLPIYQGWAEVGASFTDAKWICCYNTYDANNALIRTQWAKDSVNRIGDFTNVVGTSNTSADLLSSLTYV